ncbi:MAG TPA: 50S ribosomal protein L9 [Bellilinea sp.]|nr:50S ribosomal protein L9 [Bellilinea sp.]
MKVMLIKDVYKLGRAGDIKRVADGYGRNFLLPKGLAVLATAAAMKKVETVKADAAVQRSVLNKEMGGIAELLAGKVFTFSSKAGETGKLYGSITTQMVVDAIKEKHGVEVDRHQLEVAPIRTLGEHKAHIRLTVDLVPEITVVVYREGQVVAAKAEPAAVVEEAPAAKVKPAVEVEEVPAAEVAPEEVVAESEETSAE